MKVTGYGRVSKDEEGMSLDVQEHKIRLYCELHTLTLIDLILDKGESGKTLKRPGWEMVSTTLSTRQSEGVVVAKLDRLSRNVMDWNILIERFFGERAGFQLFSVSDSIDTRTAAGRLVLNVLMSVAQWERETIVERTCAVLSLKKTRGERVGQVPYGRRLSADGIHVEDDEIELAAIELMRSLQRNDFSLRQIAAELDRQGFPTKQQSGNWSAATVHRILARFKCQDLMQSSPTACAS